ncbi:translation initiation factor 2B, delta subunit [Aspergillus oryzae 100-8]|uniref:Translation initiation factor eIF2B subunit delta n=1 Tax=Aspergillus oryzae (strain 3.042) TaxID=1160506 RepID=I8IKS5_ASPO3|nr:translation initiation factor 2B, delta subunit [Aspergillus oryzae 3.042]KDE75472.1 translation initiation factor 2B, delta subunit [Aspergillus oryzae 100-8]|eukprot:EIT79591.1 translation initiation factor 2B, delta subunit [Aspergillus oryzae 3.042]
MANPVDPAQTSPPSTSPSPAPATQQSSDMSSQQPPSQPPQPSNGASKPAKPPKQPKSKDAPPAAGGAPGEEKLSPAELKKKAKAEKAARRAKERAEREASGGAGAGPGPNAAPPKKGSTGGGAGGKEAPGQPYKSQRHRRGSATQASATEQKKKQEDKNVAVFGHLYGQPRRTTIAGAGKEVHPAVLALGLQMRDYVVCGSSARCVATLLAFKRVIEAYTTPLGTSLSRHLTTHLSHQITYLSTCRPLSISQGNAIRALKLAISSIDPSVPEASAKATLSDFIDNFIREKITVADQVIATSAAEKIQDGDVIVTFAGSSIVKQTLLTAYKQGKKFRVSIIDSRPLFEGKNLARTLANAGLEVQYSLVNGISHAIKDATKVFLGAHAMTSNGRLYSRVGTALVAMSAKERAGGVEVPVIVCCETVKFTDRVALDSIVVNEIADADELVPSQPLKQVTGLPDPADEADTKKGDSKKGGNKAAANAPPAESTPLPEGASPLTNWKETPNLQLLNIMYDVTPAEYVDMVVTEMGSLPPSAVPIVHRMSTNL